MKVILPPLDNVLNLLDNAIPYYLGFVRSFAPDNSALIPQSTPLISTTTEQLSERPLLPTSNMLG